MGLINNEKFTLSLAEFQTLAKKVMDQHKTFKYIHM